MQPLFIGCLLSLLALPSFAKVEVDPKASRPDWIKVEVVQVLVATGNYGIGIDGKTPSEDPRVGDRIVVRGRYALSTQAKAQLSFILPKPKKNQARPLYSPLPSVETKKGTGDFELSCLLEREGALFLTFLSIPDGKPASHQSYVTTVHPAWDGNKATDQSAGEPAAPTTSRSP